MKNGFGRNTWGRKGVAGERRAEMMVWFGCCGDFGRKSSRSKPQLLETCPSGPNLLM